MGSAAVAAGQKQMAERERFEPLLLPPPSPARFIRWRERASPDKVSAIESGDAAPSSFLVLFIPNRPRSLSAKVVLAELQKSHQIRAIFHLH